MRIDVIDEDAVGVATVEESVEDRVLCVLSQGGACGRASGDAGLR